MFCPVVGVFTKHTCVSNVDLYADANVVGEDTNHGDEHDDYDEDTNNQKLEYRTSKTENQN